MFDLFEDHMALLHQIEEPARRGDNNVDTPAQVLDLTVLRNAAEDDRMAQGQMLAVGTDFIADLDCQLAGWRQNKRTWVPILAAGLVLVQRLQDWQRESCGLASAGLGDAENISTVHDFGNGLRLDRRRSYIVTCYQSTEDRLGEAEIRERTFSHLGISLYADCGRAL